MSELFKLHGTLLEKKDQSVIDTFKDTKFPEYVHSREKLVIDVMEVYENILLLENTIPDHQLAMIHAWYGLQTEAVLNDASIISEIDAHARFDVDVLVENPSTHKKELVVRHVIPTDIVRSVDSLLDPNNQIFDSAVKKNLFKNVKKLTATLGGDATIQPTLADALKRAHTVTTELNGIKEFLDWYHAVNALDDDTIDTKLLREELRHALELIEITSSGFASEDSTVTEIRELFKRIKKVPEERRRQKEVVHRLKKIKLQMARNFNDFGKRVETYKRVYGEKKVSEEDRLSLTDVMQEYTDALRAATIKIDAIIEGNHVVSLDLGVLETELLREVVDTQKKLEAVIQRVYRVTTDKKILVASQSASGHKETSLLLSSHDVDYIEFPQNYQELKALFGQNFFGIEEIDRAFTVQDQHLFSFTPEIQRRALELLNQKLAEPDVAQLIQKIQREEIPRDMFMLVLRRGQFFDGTPVTMHSLQQKLEPTLQSEQKGKLIYNPQPNQPYYTNPDQAIIDKNNMEWVFVTKDVIPETLGKKNAVQTRVLEQEARKLGLISHRRSKGWEVVSDFVAPLRLHNIRFFTDPYRYDRTSDETSDGKPVSVGFGSAGGLDVNDWDDADPEVRLPSLPLMDIPHLSLCSP